MRPIRGGVLNAYRRRGGGGGAPPLPMEGLIDSWLPAGLDLGTPQWTSSGGALARTLAQTTNPPTGGTPIDAQPTGRFTGLGALKTISGSVAQPLTIYQVFRTRNVDTTQLLSDGHTTSNRITTQVVATGVFRAFAGANLSSPASTLRADTVYRTRATFDGEASGLYVTDLTTTPVQTGTPTAPGTGQINGFTCGASNSGSSAFQGDIAAYLIYGGAHDPAAVEAFLAHHFPSSGKATWVPEDTMLSGDSITVGVGSTDGRGSRSILRLAFEAQASDVEPGVRTLRLVGPTADSCMGHHGVSGRSVEEWRDAVGAALTAHAPTRCIILIGTNNCRENGLATYDPILTPQALADGLANAYAASPSTKFAIHTVPSITNATHDANVDDLNAEIPGIVSAAAGGGMDIEILDLHAQISTSTDLDPDGVHLNDAGYAKKAALEGAWIRT